MQCRKMLLGSVFWELFHLPTQWQSHFSAQIHSLPFSIRQYLSTQILPSKTLAILYKTINTGAITEKHLSWLCQKSFSSGEICADRMLLLFLPSDLQSNSCLRMSGLPEYCDCSSAGLYRPWVVHLRASRIFHRLFFTHANTGLFSPPYKLYCS